VGAPVVVVVLGAVVVVVDDGVVIVGTVTVVEVGNGIVVVVGSGRLVVVTGMLDVVTGMLDVVTGVLDVVTGRLDVVTGRLVVVTGGTVTTGVTNVHVSAWSAGVSVTGVAGFDENPYPPKNTRWPSASSAMTGNVRRGGFAGAALLVLPNLAQPLPSQTPSTPPAGASPRQPWSGPLLQLRCSPSNIPACNTVNPVPGW
jgi:hypothetical protein